MSFGKNKSKSQSHERSDQTLDPEIRGLQLANVRALQGYANAPSAMYTGQRVAGFTAPQIEAQQGILGAARSGLGAGSLSAAVAAAQRGANFTPGQVTGGGYQAAGVQAFDPVSYAPAGVTQAGFERVGAQDAGAAGQAAAAGVDRSAIRDIQGGSVSADQIGRYMNPYTSSVVDTTMADLERQRAIQESLANAQARKAKAFGGTGAAVSASLSNEAFGRQMAQSAAQLRSQGYESALAAAQGDLARGLQATSSNQQADLAAQSTNANLLNQTRLANMDAFNRRGEFNAGQAQAAAMANQNAYNQASQFNAGAFNQTAMANAQGQLSAGQTNAQLGLQRGMADAAATNAASQFTADQAFAAQSANQNASLAAAQLGLSSAGMLGQLAGQERDFAYGDLDRIAGVGAQGQAMNQAQMDAAYEMWMAALEDQYRRREMANQGLSILGNPALSHSEGTSSSRSSGFNIGIPLPGA